MNPRPASVIILGGALLAACAAIYLWGPLAALLAAGCGAAGFAAARLAGGRPPKRTPEGLADAFPLREIERSEVPAATVATAVAAGEVPAGALLEATMDSMREGVMVIDSAMRVVASNPSARDIFGTGGEAALRRRRLSEVTRSPAVYSAFAAAVARGERAEVKFEAAGAGGARRVFDLHVAPLRQQEVVYGSDVRGAVGVFFDITQLERLERVRQEFLSNVSHELRTPLTAIITFVETLEDGAVDDPETSRRFLNVIRRNSERMRSLINDILELSAIEAGTVRVEPERLRLASLVGDCFTALAALAAERRVTLVNEVAPEVLVYADARRLEQMLTNLVDNAIKFSAEGGAVRVAHERAEGRDRVHVGDDGEGIAPEHLPRIFERFYRVDRARSRALGGTGLGLAIVKHLARAHGGEASVRSAPGEGSTFTVELPASPETVVQ
jgi:two-component system phosphate regulon sensor histidine kinase PhoR